MADISMTSSQKIAFDALMRGENVFLTGGAGTGKTTIIKQFIKEVDPTCSRTLLAAPTGKAALNLCIESPGGPIYGSTIHRLFKLKAQAIPQFNGNVPDIIQHADRIIIDEVSMVRIDIFDYVAEVIQEETQSFMRKIRGRPPLQIIFVGDFYQLPPVVKTTAYKGDSDKEILNKKYGEDIGKAYCFQSYAWNCLDIKTYELTEVMRQRGDEKFCEALNKIRVGNPAGIDYINSNCDHSEFTFDRITLCGTNKNANEINGIMLSRNPNKNYSFDWDFEINNSAINIVNLEKNMPCPSRITLCVGARVICIVNCPSAVNGQMGTIESIGEDHVIVRWDNGETNKVEAYEWKVNRQVAVKDEKGNVSLKIEPIFSVSQLPLKIAYAITIHKSQGETLESANIMMDTFETGHLYTALSRCSDVKKLRLARPLIPSDVKCDNKINEFYGGIKNETC